MRVRSASTNERVNRIPVLLAQLGKCVRKLRSIQFRQHAPVRRMKTVGRRRLPRRKSPSRMRQARKGPRMGHLVQSTQNRGFVPVAVRHFNTRSSRSIQPYLRLTIESESKLCFPDPFVAICLCPQTMHFHKKIVDAGYRLGSIERTLHGLK